MQLKLDFYLRFYTRPGQSILLVGDIPELGGGQLCAAIPLEYVNGEFWHASVALTTEPSSPIYYHYVLRNPDGTLTEEFGDDKFIDPDKMEAPEVQVIDTWNFAGEFENVFFTSPFRNVLLPAHKAVRKARVKGTVTCIFRVKAPLLEENEVVGLLGSATGLNDWKEDDPLLLAPAGDWWTIALPLSHESFPLDYKYGIYNKKEKRLTRFETGPNRHVPGDARPNKLTILHDGFVRLPNSTWHGAGVSIPVFSLRSKDSMGVGEFTDLELLVDWAVKGGLRLIQLLPVHDTTANHNWLDSYPYAAISAFALHPIYLNLEKCAGKKNAALIRPLNKK
ncbi:MAG TPA: 4-alpha-glucanotransferase, partial [Puia sp.]|nr:4-alpha-glucanotransferase [Puia sp.]